MIEKTRYTNASAFEVRPGPCGAPLGHESVVRIGFDNPPNITRTEVKYDGTLHVFETSAPIHAHFMLPAWVAVPSLIVSIFISLGYIVGFYRGRVKEFSVLAISNKNSDAYNKWRRERNSTTLSFCVIFFGCFCFVFGVTGDVQINIPYANIVASSPSIALIAPGYNIWIKAYRRK